MRLFLIAAICGLAVSAGANAANGIPKIPLGVPYERARSELIKAGFRPVPLRVRYMQALCDFPDRICRRAPEIFECGPSIGLCQFLYVRRRDGRYLFARTVRNDHRYSGAYWPDHSDIVDLGVNVPLRRADRKALAAAIARH